MRYRLHQNKIGHVITGPKGTVCITEYADVNELRELIDTANHKLKEVEVDNKALEIGHAILKGIEKKIPFFTTGYTLKRNITMADVDRLKSILKEEDREVPNDK